MNLTTKRLILKPLSKNELDGNYVNWLNNPDVCKYNSHGEKQYTKEMAADYIKAITGNPSCEVYAVYYDNKHIGNISLQCIDYKNNSAEIAYLFGEKSYWGQGFATEASEALIKRAFNDLHLHKIYFGTHIDNIGMQKVGEKLGFKKEGVFKDAFFKNGKYNDVVRYGLINNN